MYSGHQQNQRAILHTKSFANECGCNALTQFKAHASQPWMKNSSPLWMKNAYHDEGGRGLAGQDEEPKSLGGKLLVRMPALIPSEFGLVLSDSLSVQRKATSISLITIA